MSSEQEPLLRLLLNQVQVLSQTVATQPTDNLRPFAQQLNELSCRFSELHQVACKTSYEASAISMASESSTAPPNEVSSEYLDKVRTLKALSTAVRKATSLEHAIKDSLRIYQAARSVPDFDGLASRDTQRDTDLLEVLSLKPPSNKFCPIFAQRRIRLLSACVSLTQDFSDFERSCGHTPKKDHLISAIHTGEPISVQRIGRRLGQYIARYHSSAKVDDRMRKAIDVAIRMGVKLAILDSIEHKLTARSSGCLSLLMGLDCAMLARLSYSSLRHVLLEIGQNKSTLKAVTKNGNTFGDWWSHYRYSYHERYGSLVSSNSRMHSESGTATPPSSVGSPSTCYEETNASSVVNERRLSVWTASESGTTVTSSAFPSTNSDMTWQTQTMATPNIEQFSDPTNCFTESNQYSHWFDPSLDMMWQTTTTTDPNMYQSGGANEGFQSSDPCTREYDTSEMMGDPSLRRSTIC